MMNTHKYFIGNSHSKNIKFFQEPLRENVRYKFENKPEDKSSLADSGPLSLPTRKPLSSSHTRNQVICF